LATSTGDNSTSTSSSTASVIPGLGKGRLEALTDGIFGTVMTVLVLSLSVPVIITSSSVNFENMQLITALRQLLPDILAYVLSFIILSAFWVRHHSMFHLVAKVDRPLLWINIIFLLTIGFIPFSTSLLGRYPLLQLSLVIYGINLIGTSVTSQALWRYAVSKKLLIKSDALNELVLSAITRRMTAAPFGYAIGIALSFSNPVLTLALYIIILLFTVFNTTVGYRTKTSAPAP
jgi:uncharacterized membrane protein